MENNTTAIALIDIIREETNPFFNSDKARNGGGYSQPHIVYRFNDGCKVVVDDGDVGDFGFDLSVTMYDKKGEETAHYRHVEEINAAGDRVQDEIESSWTRELLKYADKTGYSIYTKEEAEAYMASNQEWDEEDAEWEDSDWE